MLLLKLIFKNFLEPFAYLIYSVIFFLKFMNKKNLELKVLFWYYLAAAVFLTGANLLVLYPSQSRDNDWIYNIVYFMTICTLSWYFYHLLYAKQKKLFVALSIAVNVTVFWVYEIFLHHFIGAYNSTVYAISFICILVYCFMYFDQQLGNVTEKNITNDFNFWLVSGYMLYFMGAFVVILLYRTVSFEETNTVWIFQSIILFISAMITTVGYMRTSARKRGL